MNTILKGLFITVVALIITTLQVHGIPTNNVGWYVLGITVLGTIAGYLAQSTLLPTSSPIGTMNWQDLVKGLLIAVSNVVSTVAADLWSKTSIDFNSLLAGIGVILFAYYCKQLGIDTTKLKSN